MTLKYPLTIEVRTLNKGALKTVTRVQGERYVCFNVSYPGYGAQIELIHS